MKTSKWWMAGTVMAVLAASCVGDAGAPGEDGEKGTDGAVSLIETATQPPGGACPNGGISIRAGLDADGSGTLSDDEVTNVEVLCHGAAGDDGDPGAPGQPGMPGQPGGSGPPALIQTTDATTCAAGGTVVSIGMDLNEDGVLQSSEVTNEVTLCNGVNGSNGSGNAGGAVLFSETPIASGNVCFAGGRYLNVGRDLDGNGTLSTGEIDSTVTVCNACPDPHATDPTAVGGCLVGRVIEFGGTISSVTAMATLTPPITVGASFHGRVVLYQTEIATDLATQSASIGRYAFTGPARFELNFANGEYGSMSPSQIEVEVMDGVGTNGADEYRVVSTANLGMGPFTVPSMSLLLADNDGLTVVSDAMRAPIAFVDAEVRQVRMTVQAPNGDTATVVGDLTSMIAR